ncbi:glycoside hydrolase family 3 N-terminal domain-containing protein [Mollicutes bacterium LVI A0078]|nr:glycoside hydrolase family 3 N-terminal domain-containing protein [Mollicutes bacterium LVI A0075]WOO91450.1 glycoside hydrolase family 3 N-terminal domain-containing protein [Mollicutes bacterium LVI A0078]
MSNINLEQILKTLTVEEKVGQLVQLAGVYYINQSEITGPLAKFDITDTHKYTAGSIIGVNNAKDAYQIQKEYLENCRHKIPLLFMADVIHGSHTMYPVPLGMSCSFNPELIENMARNSAKEAAATGVQVTFSPMADLARDARWGRNMETNGEDPYLNKVLSSSYVKGYQGEKLSAESELISCVKHFAGYGLVEAGREYNYVDLSKRVLNEFHYPAYKSAIDSGAKMVMSAFNTIESIPATANEDLLKNDLRKKLGFDGVVISDWAAVTELINHKLAADFKDAARQCANAGVDIDMMSMAYLTELEDLIQTGEVDIKLIDEMVMNVLKLKKDYGLFTDPFKNLIDKSDDVIGCEELVADAKKAADESIVLLKNDNNILPLSNKYAIVGHHVTSRDYNGPWSWQGDITKNESIKVVFSKDSNVTIVEEASKIIDIQDYEYVDTVVVFVGEKSNESGEAKSKTNIKLNVNEIEMIKSLKLIGKKVITVVFAGRPLDISDIDMYCDAIVYAWFPGSMAAQSLYDILTGRVNPSAKLSMSLPRNVGQCPIYYNSYSTGRPLSKAIDTYVSKYIDQANTPLYTFGSGLTYSNVQVKRVDFSDSIIVGDDLIIKVELENNSKHEAKEVIQVYINDLVASVIRPDNELKAFRKVTVDANSTATYEVKVDSFEFGYIGSDLNHRIDTGEFEVKVGLSLENTTNKIIRMEK